MKNENNWKQGCNKKLQDTCGATAVIVALLMVGLVGAVALAVDIGHLAVVRGELQNAADAGALAGARVLFNYDGEDVASVNPGANTEARDAAIANFSDKDEVEVDLNSDVQRGHWDTVIHQFTPNSELDISDINAVRVTTNRSASPSIFAGIFGIESFASSATAVAYRGYAGSSVDYDQPLAICKEDLFDEDGKLICTKGKMIHSGSKLATGETGRWTNFTDCSEGNDEGDNVDVNDVKSLICTDTDPVSASAISTSEGEMQPAMDKLYDCWEQNSSNKTQPWFLTLPVVQCSQPVTCSDRKGALRVKVVWTTDKGEDPDYSEIPQQMDDWTNAGCDVSSKEGRIACWSDFVHHFELVYIDEDSNEQDAQYQPVSLYFLPDCDYEAEGGPGGEEFNVFAANPVLVQ